jgi:ABC-2 type transport system permease protein
MNIRRLMVLVNKEIRYSSKNFFFIFAVLVPVVLTLIVSLMFGTLFLGKPKLGINDQGNSKLTTKLVGTEALLSKQYVTEDDLRQAVERGAVDLGLVIPQQFDTNLTSNQEPELSAYVWGESLLKNRAIIATSLVIMIREMIGQDVPIEFITTSLGDGESIPWDERLFPLIVLMAIILGGSLVPASSLVDEKSKRTLKALVATPTTLGEVFISKGLFGFLVSILVAILTLLLNRAFGSQPYLLVGVLALSALLAAGFGVLLGALIKDVNTLFATVKAIGLLLYAPAFIYLIPSIPEWIGKLFPTYYMIGPIMDISLHNATWSQVARDIYILIGLIVVMIVILAMIARRESDKEV